MHSDAPEEQQILSEEEGPESTGLILAFQIRNILSTARVAVSSTNNSRSSHRYEKTQTSKEFFANLHISKYEIILYYHS